MTDGLLTPQDREEALSRAYIQAIAAGAGYVVATQDFDRDGVDVEIQAGGAMRPALALQLKATINLAAGPDGTFRYALKRRNYDLLRLPTQVPRLLALLHLPKQQDSWLKVTAEKLVLKKCVYWAALAGLPESENRESVTISIPSANILDVASLRALMEQSRTGTIR